jgi:hypothetical protein
VRIVTVVLLYFEITKGARAAIKHRGCDLHPGRNAIYNIGALPAAVVQYGRASRRNKLIGMFTLLLKLRSRCY